MKNVNKNLHNLASAVALAAFILTAMPVMTPSSLGGNLVVSEAYAQQKGGKGNKGNQGNKGNPEQKRLNELFIKARDAIKSVFITVVKEFEKGGKKVNPYTPVSCEVVTEQNKDKIKLKPGQIIVTVNCE